MVHSFHFTSAWAELCPAASRSVLFTSLSSPLQLLFMLFHGPLMPLPSSLYIHQGSAYVPPSQESLYFVGSPWYFYFTFDYLMFFFHKLHLHKFVLVYLLHAFLPHWNANPWRLFCLVYLESRCLVSSRSPVNVSLTCNCLTVMHLLEWWHGLFFLNDWNGTLC